MIIKWRIERKNGSASDVSALQEIFENERDNRKEHGRLGDGGWLEPQLAPLKCNTGQITSIV